MMMRTAGVALLAIALGSAPDARAQEPPAWPVSDEPRVEIGVVEGAPEYQLHRAVSSVRLDDDGRIVVLNAGSHELRVYDGDGRFVRAVGRDGGGPGEFAAPVRLYRLGQDSLLVYDRGNDRFSVHALDGDFVRSERAPTPRDRFMFDEWLYDRSWIDGPPLGQGRAPVRAAVGSLPEPDPAMGYRYVKVSRQGHLWLREPGPNDAPVAWTVFDLQGRPIGHATTPARFEIHEIGPDYLLGTGRDGLDVEYIQLFRLEMPDAVPTRRIANVGTVPSFRGAADDGGEAAGADTDGAAEAVAASDAGAPPSSVPERVLANMRSTMRNLASRQEIHYASGSYTYVSDTAELEDWTDPEELDLHIVQASPQNWTALIIDPESGATCGMSFGATVPVGWPSGRVICR